MGHMCWNDKGSKTETVDPHVESNAVLQRKEWIAGMAQNMAIYHCQSSNTMGNIIHFSLNLPRI